MPLTTKLRALWLIVAVILGAWLLSPWADVVALILVAGIAPPATLFAIIYGFTVPWWQTLIGRAMLVSSAGLALLVDISLLYQWLGDDYAQRDTVRLAVFGLVFLGAWFKFLALMLEKWRAHRGNRASRFDQP
jgi:hypothetical protein